jgi:hypothetical protein
VVRYASRWSIEVMFSQIRNLLGAGQARNRVPARFSAIPQASAHLTKIR